MTDPARRARPVGPPPPGGAAPPGTNPHPGSSSRPPGTTASGQGPSGRPGYGYHAPPGQTSARVYRWSSSGQSFPWFAILLVVLGVGLLIETFIPELSFGSFLILAAGVAFGAAWLYWHMIGATMPALVLTAWGLASLGRDFDVLLGDGWNTLFIGIAFLIGWALARFQGVRREYALWIGAVLGIIGLADTSDALPIDLSIAVVIPLVMIALGLYLVWQSRILERP